MAKAKEIVGLNCEASAAGNIRLLLGVRMKEVCEFREAALDRTNIKGVHNMRVASRRLRSALKDFKPYLRRRKVASVAAELKRLADALGAVRDQDVALLALEELQAEAPAELAPGIEQLADKRKRLRDAARAALLKAIREDKLADLEKEFAATIERAIEPRRRRRKNKRSASELSFGEAGHEIILARLEELRRLSAYLYRPYEIVELHKMRISAKRLRYAMELFNACWRGALAAHAKEIAELQTSLGELHDCDVWLEDLGRLLRGFRKHEDDDDEEDGPVLTEREAQMRSAAVWLMRRYARERMKHYSDALARWHEWETRDFFKHLREAFAEHTQAVELSPAALTASEAVASDIEARESS
jgi:CHAD domain-containing protein